MADSGPSLARTRPMRVPDVVASKGSGTPLVMITRLASATMAQ